MTIDIYKYIIVFTIIISAFAAGLARFYQYYDGMVFEDEFGMKTVQVPTLCIPNRLYSLSDSQSNKSSTVVVESVVTFSTADYKNKYYSD